MNLEPFFAFARERYQILLNRRMGYKKPWTEDPILQSYRFCNIFREHDKVTQWFRENIRKYPETSVFTCVAFRLINRISSAAVLHKHRLFWDWDPKKFREVASNVKPLITAAYIIRTPYGYNKVDGLIRMLNPIWKDQQKGKFAFTPAATLQYVHESLLKYDCIGSFIAYEAVTDLRHTPLLDKASDINSWAAPGPGCARGLARVLGLPLNTFHHGSASSRAKMLEPMKEILAASRDPKYWPVEWPKWEMREPEHLCCEFDKYLRMKEGGRMKQKYNGGAE